jgi:hypothetical protein
MQALENLAGTGQRSHSLVSGTVSEYPEFQIRDSSLNSFYVFARVSNEA